MSTFTARRSLRFVFVLPVLVALLLGAMWLAAPVERTGRIGLQFTFDGADRGHFPNGIPFAPTEVIEKPVLAAVFAQMKLGGRVDFERFAQSFLIAQSGGEVEALHVRYRGALADTRLSPVDRSRLEDEYRAKLNAVAGEPAVVLAFRQPGRTQRLSDDEVQQALLAVVKTWADSALELKGALRYDVDVYGPGLFANRGYPGVEFLVAIDAVRTGLVRIQANLDTLGRQPGITAARVVDDAGVAWSLADLSAEVADLLSLRVQPLVRQAVGGGFVRDAAVVAAYYRSRFQLIDQDRVRVATKVAGIEGALRAYGSPSTGDVAASSGGGAPEGATTLIPQVSEAFIDRMFELSDSREDLAFRQGLTRDVERLNLSLAAVDNELSYYRDALPAVSGLRSAQLADTDPAYAALATQLESIATAAASSAAKVERLYREASVKSLSTGEQLYRQVRDFEYETSRALDTWRTRIVAAVLLLAGLLVGWVIDRVRD